MNLFSGYVIENYWKKGLWTLDLGYTTEKKDTSPLLEHVSECKVRGAQVYEYETCNKISIFRDNHLYSLKMYGPVPLLEIDGLRMHLLKEWETPFQYARAVVEWVGIKKGQRVLDTCMGLGYLAIESAKKGAQTTTIEKSSAVLEIASINPFSKPLFELPIEVLEGDSYDLIENFSSLDVILHDPPRFTHASLLYSRSFYKKCKDALREGGLLYHYVGSLGRNKGFDILEATSKRIEQSGFKVISKSKRFQAVLARRLP